MEQHANSGFRPSLDSFFTNLHAPLPWPVKIRLLVRNNWIKIRYRRNCCGHPGEPGC
jgi:hypothetical protein